MKYPVLQVIVLVVLVACTDHCCGQSTVSLKPDNNNQTEVAALHNALDILNIQLKAEISRREALQSEVNEEKSKTQALESQVTALQQQVSGLSDKVSKGGQQVGFSSYGTSCALYPADGDTIPFRGIHLNQGGHYNPTTSVYTCPSNGTYWFTFSIWSQNIRSGTNYHLTTGSLVQDAQILARAYCRNDISENDLWLQCSQSALTHCNQGSTVWVRSDYTNNKVCGTSNKWSTFSGFLLYAD